MAIIFSLPWALLMWSYVIYQSLVSPDVHVYEIPLLRIGW